MIEAYPSILNAGLQRLAEGQAVEYELQLSPKGLQAVLVASARSGGTGVR